MPNRCILCKKEYSEKLTKEHIINKALGGPWTLPNASCQICQKKCNEEFENDFLKGPNIVAYQRSLWGLKGRNQPPIYGMPGHGGQMLSEVGTNFPKVSSIQFHGQIDAPPQVIFVNKNGDATRHRIIKSDFPIPRPISAESMIKLLGEIPAESAELALYANGEKIVLNIWNELVAVVHTIATQNNLGFKINSTPVTSSDMSMPINHIGINRTYAKVAFCYLLRKIDQSLWFNSHFDQLRSFILNGDNSFITQGNIKDHNSNTLDPIYETIGAIPFTYYITVFRVDQAIWSSVLLPGFGKKYIKISEKYIPPQFNPAITLFDISSCKSGDPAKAIEILETSALMFEQLVQIKIFNKLPKVPQVSPIILPIFPVYAEVQEDKHISIEIYPNFTIKQLGTFPSENHLRVIKQLSNSLILTVGFDYSRGATLYTFPQNWEVKGKIPNIRSITSICECVNGNIFCAGQAQNESCEIWYTQSTMEKWTKVELPIEIIGMPIIDNIKDETITVAGNIRNQNHHVFPIILESNDSGSSWNIAWQGNDLGYLFSLSKGNGYFGTNGKPAIIYQNRDQWRDCTKVYVSPSNQEERIQEISEFTGIVVAGINRFNKGGYCIYSNANDHSKWNNTAFLPNNEDIIGVACWKPTLQLVCSSNALYASSNLGMSWEEIFRPDPNQGFFKLEKLPSGEVLLLSSNTIWYLKNASIC